ncbi:histone-like nucleoid-structuring protein Lsr2 [Streptomyces sp. NPDC056400]|uniref:Lsr2 family DNA-binding protein n=1 Tax=Streptomyces sp. NPDC056400 TaxID=3345808 RepID=UPI0035D82F0E
MPARLRSQLEEVRQAARHPWPLPHDPQHLFAMGVTGNTDYLFWVTEPADTPQTWKVAVNEALRQPWFTHDGTLTELLFLVLDGTLQVPMFPKDLLEGGVSFAPSLPHEPSVQPASAGTVSPRAIRAWARANGFQVEDRGRIPPDVMAAWEQSHPR